jgi:hypothetical protein
VFGNHAADAHFRSICADTSTRCGHELHDHLNGRRSPARHPVLRELLARYQRVTFNDAGVSLTGDAPEFRSG